MSSSVEAAATAAKELEQKKREIFVRNLSYETTSDELIELFQEIGPIKRGSITLKDGVSRGFGFIKFALEEDAATAIAQLNGREFKGRNLIIETAVNKGQNPLLDGADSGIKSKKAVKAPGVSETPKLFDLGDAKQRKLQLVVFGVSAAIGKKAFRKYLKTVSKKATVHVITADHPLADWINDVSYSFPATATDPHFKPLLVTAADGMDLKRISDAINAPGNNGILHRKLLDYSKQVAEEGGNSDDEDADVAVSEVIAGAAIVPAVYAARAVNILTEARLRKRKCRLIVRNLSFQATEANIATKLLPFGPLTEVHVSRVAIAPPADPSKLRQRYRKADNEGNPSQPKMKSRGFAFVTFLCENDAKKAVEKSNGIKICNREFALDFCTAKDKMTAEEQVEAGVSGDVDGKDGMSVSEGGDSEDNDDSEEGSDEEQEGSDEEQEGLDEEQEGSDEESGSQAESNDDDESPEAAPKAPPKPTDVKEGKTIFIRDLPFDAVVADVRRAFRPFGPITMCVLVTDKETGLSKGSAFLKYAESEHAVKAAESSQQLSSGVASTGPIYVNGKPARVDLALERDQAKRLDEGKAQGARADGGKDKRNLYLSNEGLGVGSQLLEEDMPEQDKEKRKRAHQEKRKKLQNPLFFVSATRLCVRNLKKSVTDQEFRELCIKATKEGMATGKVKPADMDVQLSSQGLNIRERPAEALVVPNLHGQFTDPASGKKSSYLKNLKAKIMRDTTRLKEGSGEKPPSRGYGFVEFQHHGHALACLRQLNNNLEYCDFSMSHSNQDPSKRPRLIVEFSLEDTRKVTMLKKRTERVTNKTSVSAAEGETAAKGKVRKSRGNKGIKKKNDSKVQQATREDSNKPEKKKESETNKKAEKQPPVAKPAEIDAGINTKLNNKRKNKEALKKHKESKKQKRK